MKGAGVRILVLLLIIFGGALTGGWWILSRGGGAKAKPKQTAQVAEARVEPEVAAPDPNVLTLPGTIEPFERVVVTPKLTAEVAKLLVREGETVRAGQLLCVLAEQKYNKPFVMAQLAHVQAQENLRLAQGRRAIERANKQLAVLRAKQELARAETQPETQAELAIRRKTLEIAQLELQNESVSPQEIKAMRLTAEKAKVELAEVQQNSKATQITAPVGGTVHIVTQSPESPRGEATPTPPVGAGLKVVAGAPLFEIVNNVQGCIRLEVDETDIGKFRLGMPAKITGDGFPGKELAGKVVGIQASANKAGENVSLFPVTVLIKSLQGVRLGMTADVTFDLKPKTKQGARNDRFGCSLIQLREVKKVYKLGKVPVEALRGISLRIEQGELAAIMGPSGSGKTTLLNVLGLLDAPSVGSYMLEGDEVAKLADRRRNYLRNRRFGFIFQVYNLMPRLAALENVMVPLIYAGVKRSQRRPKAVAALEAVGLAERLEHRPAELSGGEQQRVAIARALVTEPAVILADEPTGNLDSVSGAGIMELLQQLHRERKVTIVMVTHDQSVADRAERIIRLKDGQVLDGATVAGQS